MLRYYRSLQAKHILSMNQRNQSYIARYNRRCYFPLVDDKLKTKQLAMKHSIAVPALYGVLNTPHEIESFETMLEGVADFVIKPARGCGGDGIMVISNTIKHYYRQANGRLLTKDAMRFHLNNIINGVYSLGNHYDHVLLEQRVVVDSVFHAISSGGVPDLRIICLLGYPVMAMLRLPTLQSEGKANLHQGAIGVGVDIATGQTATGVWHHDVIEFHPDTLNELVGFTVPYWKKVLEIASRCYEFTCLGYLGIDIVLDKERGPLMLELNARPGLNIQIANQVGLLERLQRVERCVAACSEKRLPSYTERIQFAQKHFSMKI